MWKLFFRDSCVYNYVWVIMISLFQMCQSEYVKIVLSVQLCNFVWVIMISLLQMCQSEYVKIVLSVQLYI